MQNSKKEPFKDPLIEGSLRVLNAITTHPAEDFVIPSLGNRLFRVCDLIGQTMEITFKSTGKETETLEQICAVSGVRYRMITLTKNWWKESHGPLLGFWKETNEPVAIIYIRNHYEIIDPMSGKRISLDQVSSQKLSLTAVMFYHSIPENYTTLTKILQFCMQGNMRDYVAIIFAGFLTTLISFFFPVANKVIFDFVIPHYNISLFLQVILGLIVATLGATFFLFTRSLIMLRLNGIIQNRFQISTWDRLLKLPMTFFNTIASGDLIQRTLILDTIRQRLNENTLRIIMNGLFGFAYIIVMFFFSWQLSLIGIFIAGIGSFISALLFFIKLKYDRKVLQSNASINSFLTQVINAISKLRIAVGEKRVFSRWAKEFSISQRQKLRSQSIQAGVTTTNTILTVLSFLLLFAVVISMINDEKTASSQLPTSPISVGTYLAFTAAYIPFTQAFFDLTGTFISLIALIPFWERTKPIFTTPIENSSDQIDPGELKGNILVDNISFRYNKTSSFILENFSLYAKAGEFIGIVGPSGRGKSTLCRLLIGFEIPEKGKILYDNKDLLGLDTQKVRSQMGIILQNNPIFSGTIKENITLGESFTSEQMQQALQLSTFDEDLQKFPMGLESLLPSGGGVLSGGQRQRLALTRVFIRQPKILIFDEATSFLDNKTQERVFSNIISLGITRIVVAHRKSTIKSANRIYEI